VRWKTVPQMSGCDRKRSVADRAQSDEYVEYPVVDEAESSHRLASCGCWST